LKVTKKKTRQTIVFCSLFCFFFSDDNQRNILREWKNSQKRRVGLSIALGLLSLQRVASCQSPRIPLHCPLQWTPRLVLAATSDHGLGQAQQQHCDPFGGFHVKSGQLVFDGVVRSSLLEGIFCRSRVWGPKTEGYGW
jgi:hypothetical protein